MSQEARDFIAHILGPDGRYVEIRAFGAGPPIQRFFTNPDEAADYALHLDREGMDVYVGMAPRDRKSGTADDVSQAYIVSADCDDDASIAALEAFPLAPSLRIESGGRTPTGKRKIHAHWFVDPIDSNVLVQVKGELSRALRSDAKIVDAPRVMRLPGTTNRKPGAGVVSIAGGDWAGINPDELRNAIRTIAPRVDTRAAEIFGSNTFELPDVIMQGNRDDVVYKYACRLRGRGLDHDEILACVRVLNETRVDPPLHERDLARITKSACRHDAPAEPAPPTEWLPSEPWSVFRRRVDERVAYLVHELVIQGGLGVIGAPAKAGKTWLAELLAVCLATGTPFLDWDVPEPVRVLYLALEGSASGHKKRFAVLARGLGLDPDTDELLADNLEIVTQPPSGLNLVTPEHGARFVERILDGGYRASFVDVVRAAAKIRETGEGAVDIRQLQSHLRPLVDAGHTTTFVHHAKKYEAANKGAYVPALERLSGSGDWGGVVDFGLVLDKDKRGWRHARLHIEGRDIPTPAGAIHIEYVGDGSGSNGGILYHDRVEARLVEEDDATPDLAAKIAGWLAQQERSTATGPAIRAQFELHKTRLSRLSYQLKNQGVEIVQQEGKEGVYTLRGPAYG